MQNKLLEFEDIWILHSTSIGQHLLVFFKISRVHIPSLRCNYQIINNEKSNLTLLKSFFFLIESLEIPLVDNDLHHRDYIINQYRRKL